MRFPWSLFVFFLVSPLFAAKKPNILLINTDDQRFDTIRALGNSEIRTPHLDELVNRGFVFTNAYNQGSMIPAVCAPSRTMLLTGKSLFRIPSPTAKTYSGSTLGKSFTDSGYATLCVSKPGNSFALGHSAFSKVVHIPHVGASTCQKTSDAVIDFLKADRGEKPFFIYYAPSTPHDPREAPEEFTKQYDPHKLSLSKNFMPEHLFDNGELKVRDETLAAFPRTEKEMKKHLAEYYACISCLDHHLGRIFEQLKEAKRLENTWILFTSDQGLAVGGRHGLMGKQNLYEHIKPPLIVVGPGLLKGKSDALVYLFDLYPTICDLADIPIPKEVEGKSLKPILSKEKKHLRDALFAAYKDCQRMVRDNRWKLIWYPKIDRFQLFDLANDPEELKDLSANPEYVQQLKRLKALLGDQQKQFSDSIASPIR